MLRPPPGDTFPSNAIRGVSMEKYGAGSIVVSDYDPNWPILFEEESTRIKKALGSFALAIEHMGSTAVPGLPSKPIIDLLVGVPSLEEARERCIEPIEALGYNYVPEYASWIPGELFFRKGPPGPWTHHVHLMEPSSRNGFAPLHGSSSVSAAKTPAAAQSTNTTA